MEFRVLYITKSKKSAIFSYEKDLGFAIVSQTGFMKLPKNSKAKIGDTYETTEKLSTRVSIADDGTEFTWFTL